MLILLGDHLKSVKNICYLIFQVLFSSGFMNDMSMSARGSTKDVILDDYKRVTELFTAFINIKHRGTADFENEKTGHMDARRGLSKRIRGGNNVTPVS